MIEARDPGADLIDLIVQPVVRDHPVDIPVTGAVVMMPPSF